MGEDVTEKATISVADVLDWADEISAQVIDLSDAIQGIIARLERLVAT